MARIYSDRDREIVALWNKGQMSMSQIGDRHGMSRSAVSGVLTRARDAGIFVVAIDRSTASQRMADALHSPFEERNRRFIAEWNEGELTLSRLAQKFGLTKKAAGGIIHNEKRRGTHVISRRGPYRPRRHVNSPLVLQAQP